jgi:hypothetical protein
VVRVRAVAAAVAAVRVASAAAAVVGLVAAVVTAAAAAVGAATAAAAATAIVVAVAVVAIVSDLDPFENQRKAWVLRASAYAFCVLRPRLYQRERLIGGALDADRRSNAGVRARDHQPGAW